MHFNYGNLPSVKNSFSILIFIMIEIVIMTYNDIIIIRKILIKIIKTDEISQILNYRVHAYENCLICYCMYNALFINVLSALNDKCIFIFLLAYYLCIIFFVSRYNKPAITSIDWKHKIHNFILD